MQPGGCSFICRIDRDTNLGRYSGRNIKFIDLLKCAGGEFSLF